MRVAQLMLAKGFGGAERSFVDLCRALAGRGHAVLALCERRGMARGELEGTAGVQIAPVTVRGTWDPLAVRALRRALERFGAELAHAHLARAAHLGGRAAAALGLPVIAKTHNYVALEYYRHVRHFVATTEDQRRYLLAAGVAGDRITVIPNFCALPPAAGPVRPRGALPALLTYGRLVRKKGFEVLLEALALAHARGRAFSCTIGGDGPSRAALARRRRALGLEHAVPMPGWLGAVAPALDTHEAFVLPSLDEPFGIVLLEAMARGLPIVSTRTQGPAEILDEHCALLCPAGDPGALAAALETLADAPAAAAARATEALARYRSRYHVDAVLPRYLECYAALLGARRPS